MLEGSQDGREKPAALALLSSQRPRNLSWFGAAGLLFGDWGTSRLYVLGLAFLVGGRTSFWLIAAMGLLVLAVGWAYTQICRIYPDGGGVYTAGKQRYRLLGVVGALLLFADYTVTASLSALDAFHYFGLTTVQHVEQSDAPASAAGSSPRKDPGDEVRVPSFEETETGERLFSLHSPALWAVLAIVAIGAFNLMGPKHTSAFAMFTAGGMTLITLLIVVFALPQIDWRNIQWGNPLQHPLRLWEGFVFIVLALSGVEAVANLTGVMHKPVFHTARKSIWTVALEVAGLNLLLAVIMISLAPPRNAHTADMLAFMARSYIGPWGEWPVRIIGGLLLLSATNTAVNGLMSITYVMSRDGEMPAVFQKLNGWGAPWVGAVLAAGVPAVVLLFFHDLGTLASLYAIGVVGAVAINCTLCAYHPRLRRHWRKIAMLALGVVLVAIWVTLALTKLHATAFVSIVLAVGLTARAATQWWGRRKGPRPSLLRQAIMEQLTPVAMGAPKMLLGTYGSDALAPAALREARTNHSTLVVCFIREVSLSIKWDERMTMETDAAAQRAFSRYLDLAHEHGVPIMPVYDMGPDAAVLMAENAAIYGCEKILIGTSRRGALHRLIKGGFQRRLEGLLPAEIQVEVINPDGDGQDHPAQAGPQA